MNNFFMKDICRNFSLFKTSRDKVRTLSLLIILAGLILRTGLVLYAENRLDFDETTVGIMAVNILEGKDYPIAFYGAPHNIGGAVEAYLTAILFAGIAVSPLMVKFSLILIWFFSAVLFYFLAKKIFSGISALCAVVFFSFPPLFFLDFSMKARGGFAEAVFCGILLCLLALIVREKSYKPLSSWIFGMVCGLSYFISEMNVIMIGCLCLWLLFYARREWFKYIKFFLSGVVVGLLPSILYNIFVVAGANIKQSAAISVLKAVLNGNTEHILSLHELTFSFSFILWPVLAGSLLLLFFAGKNIFQETKSITKEFGVLLILYVLLFTFAYYLNGHRYNLPIPSSRVLYPLYPALACFAGYAVYALKRKRPFEKFFISVTTVVCFVIVLVAIQNWFISGKPLSHNSWYGKWSYVNGEKLYKILISKKINNVFCSYHIGSPFVFYQKLLINADNTSPKVNVYLNWHYVCNMHPEQQIAIIGFPGSVQMQLIHNALRKKRIKYQYGVMDNLMIIFGLNAGDIIRTDSLPGNMNADVMPPPGSEPKGFNRNGSRFLNN